MIHYEEDRSNFVVGRGVGYVLPVGVRVCGDGFAAGRADCRRRGDAGHRCAALYDEGRLSYEGGICRHPERHGREGAEGRNRDL